MLIWYRIHPQIDDEERGFSYMRNGPLDCRMDTNSDATAEDFVNSLSERQLAKVITEVSFYG